MMFNLYSIDLLKNCREYLIGRYLSKDPELYKPMFSYRKNKTAMDLYQDKILVEWINYHFTYMKIKPPANDIERKKAIENIRKLMDNNLGTSEIFRELLLQKITIIDSLLSSEEKMQEKLNQLSFSYERDKDLFEQRIEKYL